MQTSVSGLAALLNAKVRLHLPEITSSQRLETYAGRSSDFEGTYGPPDIRNPVSRAVLSHLLARGVNKCYIPHRLFRPEKLNISHLFVAHPAADYSDARLLIQVWVLLKRLQSRLPYLQARAHACIIRDFSRKNISLFLRPKSQCGGRIITICNRQRRRSGS